MKKMKSLCIIGCGKKKIWDENPEISFTEARELYTGSFTKKCIEYADKFHSKSFCILSAKYGLIFPDEKIQGPYSECFHHKKSNPITIEELKMQIKNKQLDEYDEIIIIGGKYYEELIKSLFPKKNIINPLKDCKGIGHMMKKLNESIG